MKRKIIASILSVVLLGTAVTAYGKMPQKSNDSLDGTAAVNEELKLLIAENPDDIYPVDIWISELDQNELQQSIKEKLGYSLEDIDQSYDLDKVMDYVSTERQLYANRQKAINNSFIADNGLNKFLEAESTFVSSYSPMIHVEMKGEDILLLAQSEEVQSVLYSPDVEVLAAGNIAEQTVKADTVRDTVGLTGDGIKIGIIEESGFPDFSSGAFDMSNVTVDPIVQYVTDTFHATNVTYLIAGQQMNRNGIVYQGVVPDSEIYLTYKYGDWRERIEWLLSQEVVVINMSLYFGTADLWGSYTANDLWLDHVGINHSVHIVVAAGNTNRYDFETSFRGYVTNPGMAYNVITVGGINDNRTTVLNDDGSYYREDEIYGYFWGGAYRQKTYSPNKPEICAPAQNIYFAVTGCYDNGTSYAAPYVTGIIAQLCEQKPFLIVKQACVKAIITASTSHPLAQTTNSSGWDEYGAGVIDAVGSYNTVVAERYVASAFSEDEEYTSRYYTITATPNDSKLRVSLSWLVNNSFSNENHTAQPSRAYLADLDLIVRDSNGVIVAQATSSCNNTEIVQFNTGNVAATYSVEVRLGDGSYDDADNRQIVYYGLAWW